MKRQREIERIEKRIKELAEEPILNEEEEKVKKIVNGESKE